MQVREHELDVIAGRGTVLVFCENTYRIPVSGSTDPPGQLVPPFVPGEVIVPSGPPVERNGVMVQPMGSLHACEGCGAPNVPFLINVGGKLLSYCGWDGKNPICVNKAKEAEHG